jgi:hypothetical protein
MAKLALGEFLSDRNQLALKISSADLAGLFRKSFSIPARTAGLAFFADGTTSLLQEGQEVSGKFDLTLAKRGEVQLRLVFPDLLTRDRFAISATAGIAVELSLGRADLFRDFCRALFSFPGAYTTADLKTHLANELRSLLSGYVGERPAAELHRADRSGPLGEILRDSLERFLFDAGVRYLKLLELSLVSVDYERRVADEKRRADEAARSAEVMERKEERLRRLAGILKDQEVQGLLTRVPDEKLKGLLYAKLMEDDAVQITAEELLSKAKDCGEEVVQVIYKAMENLLSTGASVSADEVESLCGERIFAAAGPKVLELDPEGKEQPRIYSFKDPLRSVRYVETPKGDFLVGGSRHCVYAVAFTEEMQVLEYPLPAGRSAKGGVNSVALSGDSLFATHSEYGLARWRLDRPEEAAELLYPEVTRPHKTTRACSAQDGRLLFASGHHVYSAAADGGGEPVKYISSVEAPVSCVASAARTIFAGTESGSILCWKADAPDQPVVLVRKRDAIVNLRLAKICGIPHLIYSAKDLSVRARVVGQNLETSYESDGASVGVLDAASDLICASDANGRKVLVWKATAPARPFREIEVWKQSEKPVLDLWMKKGRARSA